MQIKSFLKQQKQKIVFAAARKNLINKDFTLISNNCWGGRVYQDLNQEYRSPFIGLFLYLDDYIKLLENFKYYMDQNLEFTNISKHAKANEERADHSYPLGLLDDVEIHFLHYKDELDARTKWERRKERINWDNLFVKISEADDCTIDILEKFDVLDFKNKVSFTRQEYKNLKFNVILPNYSISTEMNNYHKHINIVEWLNEGRITVK